MSKRRPVRFQCSRCKRERRALGGLVEGVAFTWKRRESVAVRRTRYRKPRPIIYPGPASEVQYVCGRCGWLGWSNHRALLARYDSEL
jgi:DNA-directed RNA polymerase subunit RPC12/RpoP